MPCPYFNPRTPCGVRPKAEDKSVVELLFQSTHPLRGATGIAMDAQKLGKISIHAPLAGCDCIFWKTATSPSDFNPRTPCGVRREKP